MQENFVRFKACINILNVSSKSHAIEWENDCLLNKKQEIYFIFHRSLEKYSTKWLLHARWSAINHLTL